MKVTDLHKCGGFLSVLLHSADRSTVLIIQQPTDAFSVFFPVINLPVIYFSCHSLRVQQLCPTFSHQFSLDDYQTYNTCSQFVLCFLVYFCPPDYDPLPVLTACLASIIEPVNFAVTLIVLSVSHAFVSTHLNWVVTNIRNKSSQVSFIYIAKHHKSHICLRNLYSIQHLYS